MKEAHDTPSSQWSATNEEDPHKGKYDCRRIDLTLGDLTDDQLANDVFLYGDNKPSIHEIMAGTAKMPVIYLTAGKERIRWLSRQNESNKAIAKEMEDMLAEVLHNMEVGNSDHTEINDAMIPRISSLLAKARGEA